MDHHHHHHSSTMDVMAVDENSLGGAGTIHDKSPMMRRTQSYDGVESDVGGDSQDHEDSLTEGQSPLHVSFDVSQLNAYQSNNSRGNEMPPPPGTARKQQQQQQHHHHPNVAMAAPLPRNYLDILNGASNSSSSCSTTNSASAKTPVRTRFHMGAGSSSKKATGKRTPASARRHRLFNRRSSPGHRTPGLARATGEPTSGGRAQLHQQLFAQPPVPLQAMQPPSSIWKQPELPREPSALFLEPAATPAGAKPAKRSLGTVTTVANSTILETTTETDDSADSNHHNHDGAAQTFQFSSFPASLPRIPANAPQKRMALETFDSTDCAGRNLMADQFATEQRPVEQQHSRNPSFAAPAGPDLGDVNDEMSTSPIGTPVGRRKLNFGALLSPAGTPGDSPGTPNDVRMHFQSKECSPIRGIPEEDGDLTTSLSEKHTSMLNHSLDSSEGSHQAANGSGGSGSRPMPDMGAFEMDASHDSSSEKAGSAASARSHAQSPKLLCPPTPVRTPAWLHGDSSHSNGSLTDHHTNSKNHHAHHLAKFGRQNSLIATKVLATCSQRDLEGRTSLENSLLEEEGSKQPMRPAEHNSANGSSIMTGNSSDLMVESAEPEMEHASSDRERSFHHHSHDNSQSTEEDDNWLHDRRRESRLFDDDDESGLPAPTEVVSMSKTFEILGMLGRGTFADVYKVRSKKDGNLYAVKKHRRQFRGRRDREMTMAEVRHMQRLQSTHHNGAKSNYCLYLLFFYQAWQEEGHFFCQTELCCRDTCREFMDSLRLNWVTGRNRYPCLRRLPAPLGIAAGSDQDIIGRMVPESTVWKICHDVSAGLSHMHSHGLVHYDLKPSNVFFVAHAHFGAMCKIGDFGMAGDIGTSEDGQEGDQKYMAPELLSSDVKHPSADMFSLGLTLYELASSLSFEVPAEGQLWHDLRSGRKLNNPSADLPPSRDSELVHLIRRLIAPDRTARPLADALLQNTKVQRGGIQKDEFLTAYLKDVQDYDLRMQDMEAVNQKTDDQTPRVLGGQRPRLCISPSLTMPSAPPIVFSPKQAPPFA